MSPPLQEEDTVATGRLVLVMVATVALTLGCLLWVALVMRPFERASRGEAAPLRAAPVDPGSPDRTLFEPAGFSAARLEHQRQLLGSYGVVDAAKGIVRIPIERAMEIVAKGAP